jgi:hypothetical protein
LDRHLPHRENVLNCSSRNSVEPPSRARCGDSYQGASVTYTIDAL